MNSAQTLFFEGKVSVQQLPAFEPGKGNCPPLLKRLILAKGELAQFHDSEDPIRYMAWLELREGQARGNHFHRVKQEHLYLAGGDMLLRLKDLRTQEEIEVGMETGALVRIEPGVAHVFIPVSNGFAVEFSPTRFDAEDIYAFPFAGA